MLRLSDLKNPFVQVQPWEMSVGQLDAKSFCFHIKCDCSLSHLVVRWDTAKQLIVSGVSFSNRCILFSLAGAWRLWIYLLTNTYQIQRCLCSHFKEDIYIFFLRFQRDLGEGKEENKLSCLFSLLAIYFFKCDSCLFEGTIWKILYYIFK